jgi:uncharacterized protein
LKEVSILNIDAHVHLVGDGWIHEDFLLNMARVAAAGAGKASGEPPDAAMLVEVIRGGLMDTSGEKLVAEMDSAGVDRSCVFAVDYGLLTGEPGVPIAEQNRLVAEAVKRFPDRLIGFCAVDPRRPEALALFQRAVEDWGLKGLKLHPTAGYFPYDPAAYPLYRKCQEYKLPVLIHTGSQPGPMKSRFARPVYVDDVAADFPDLAIIIAHCGHHWWEEALMVCTVKPNCYVDISGWQRDYLAHPHIFYAVLRRFLDAIGPWRIFFATDGPYLNVLCPLDQWVKAVREPSAHEGGVVFDAEEIDIIMGRAFARLTNN